MVIIASVLNVTVFSLNPLYVKSIINYENNLCYP